MNTYPIRHGNLLHCYAVSLRSSPFITLVLSMSVDKKYPELVDKGKNAAHLSMRAFDSKYSSQCFAT